MRRSYFWMLTSLGIITMANVAVRFLKHPPGWTVMHYGALVLIAASTAIVWWLYVEHMRIIAELAGRVDDPNLARLAALPYSMGFFCFLIVNQALLLLLRI